MAAHDDDAVQRGFALHQAGQDADEVTAHSAADAAVVHLKDLFFSVELLLDERVIDADLTELLTGKLAVLARSRSRSSGRRVGERWRWRRVARGRGGESVCAARTSFSITAIFLP